MLPSVRQSRSLQAKDTFISETTQDAVAIVHYGGSSRFQSWAMFGWLLSYGPDLADICRQAARFVDKIVKGAKPGDLPVEQPTKFMLLIILRTAKALGLTLPASLLGRADEGNRVGDQHFSAEVKRRCYRHGRGLA